jgi:hypothetical protein
MRYGGLKVRYLGRAIRMTRRRYNVSSRLGLIDLWLLPVTIARQDLRLIFFFLTPLPGPTFFVLQCFSSVLCAQSSVPSLVSIGEVLSAARSLPASV